MKRLMDDHDLARRIGASGAKAAESLFGYEDDFSSVAVVPRGLASVRPRKPISLFPAEVIMINPDEIIHHCRTQLARSQADLRSFEDGHRRPDPPFGAYPREKQASDRALQQSDRPASADSRSFQPSRSRSERRICGQSERAP